MRKINYTTQFERDFKLVKRNPNYKNFEALLEDLVIDLQNDSTILAKFQDHSLLGEYKECRECHLKPDLLLIYEKPDRTTLTLIRLGSHAQLF